MSVLDDTFTFFTTKPPVGYVWKMDATLTGTKLHNLPAGVATAAAVPVTYASGPPATISFDLTFVFELFPKVYPPFPVTLTQTAGGYSMKIVLPWMPGFNCDAKVDAASGVVYGSQKAQFVTLVLKAGTEQG